MVLTVIRGENLMKMNSDVSDEVLRNHNCLEKVDKVSGDSETTAFKRRARLQQALWREKKGLEEGTQPIRPKDGKPSRPLGSRIKVDDSEKGKKANFLNDKIYEAVEDRVNHPQKHQMLNTDRLYFDLLSSMPMCFNLFGVLHSDLNLADKAVHAWWPNTPGKVSAVNFEWSQGRRLKGEFLENRTAFDVAFKLDLGNGNYGIIGVETKYHEHCKAEKAPKDYRLSRYTKVSEDSGVFKPGSVSKIINTKYQQIWLDHLLALSMLQHPQEKCSWAKFVLVHPERNPSFAKACHDYKEFLQDDSSFCVNTIESLLEAGVLPEDLIKAFKERYLW
jgi:hypothetical protein